MYGNNPYYQQRFQNIGMPQQNMQQTYIPQTQPIQQNIISSGIQGKIVDSIDVVKVMEYPLDGTVSYFPLTDNSAIVTKQLQSDGTSKTTVYKPVDNEQKEIEKYVTFDDLKKSLNDIDFSEIEDLKEELDSIKKQLKELKNKSKQRDD